MNHDQTLAPRWLTLEGAAKYTGLSQRTIENYIKDGLIISANVMRPGASRGRRLVERPSLDAFIEQFIGMKCEIAMNSQKQRPRS
jgi:excisionase family DNA binding protein